MRTDRSYCTLLCLLWPRNWSSSDWTAGSLLLIHVKWVSHLGTITKPYVADMDTVQKWSLKLAIISIFSKNNGEQASDILPGNKGSEPAIPSLRDRLQASQKSQLTWKHVVRKKLSAADSHHRKWACCSTNPKCVTPSSRVCEPFWQLACHYSLWLTAMN